MPLSTRIEAAVHRAVDKVNELLPESQRLQKTRATRLLDEGTDLDSLSVINLLVFLEDELNDTFDREVILTGVDDSFQIPEEDLRSLGSLITALERKLAIES
jgi:acyl carrier protein